MRRRLLLLPLLAIGCGGGAGGRSSSGGARVEYLAANPDVSVSSLTSDGRQIFGGNDQAGFFRRWKSSSASELINAGASSGMAGIALASANGNVILGQAQHGDTYGPAIFSFRTGFRELPMPTGSMGFGFPLDLSADGSVVLASDILGMVSERPYIVRNGIATVLPVSPGMTAFARAISADGSTVVGTMNGAPVRWVDGGNPQTIGSFRGIPTAVSADGQAVAGTFYPEDSTTAQAFRWSANGGFQVLDSVDELERGVEVLDISGDGTRVLISDNQDIPVLWIVGKGSRTLRTILVEAGVDLSAGDLKRPRALSLSGKVVIGNVREGFPYGENHPWKAVIP